MSIKQKIVLLTTLWLVGILLVLNLLVYFAFLRITTDNEQDWLVRSADTLLQKLHPEDLIQGRNTELLQSYLPDAGMIRLLDSKGSVLHVVQNDPEQLQLAAETVASVESDLYRLNQGQVLMVRIPMLVGADQVGTFEMSERLDSIEENTNTLITVLILSSIGAIGLSLVGGFYLSKWILGPISSIVRVMENIERSLVFQKIPLDKRGNDELHTMATTFNRMVDRLEESFIRQQQFVSDASHEMNTPLTIIEGYARMLTRWGLKDEASAKEAVESIHSEAVRMKQMTQQLLDLSSAENKEELHLEELEIVSFCEQTIEPLRKLYQRKIHIAASANKIYLTVDVHKLKQILLILLDNALKYSMDSIELMITETKRETPDGAGVEIRVKDYGIGIPKEEQPRVFERFYRVDSSRQRKTGGTGLGLSIARNLVRQHGGTISIQSEEHAGTEVIINMPAHPS